MAYQASVLRNGEWVTETRSVQAVIKANSNPAKAPKKPLQSQAPQCGILTQTAFESQQVNLILPVRLRSPRHNDIAFVRNNSVHIFELHGNDQHEASRLVEVCYTSEFGPRVRNAAVIGLFAISDNGRGQEDGLPKIDVSSPPSLAQNTSAAFQLPPQQLILVLETGDSVFLSAQERPPDKWVLARKVYPNPTPGAVYMGFHLAIDPSSRYMVQASHHEYFVVYELKSYDTQNEQYRQGIESGPVRSYHVRSIKGVIHKAVFLYPRPEDDNHVILLLIVVRNNKARMVIYDWVVGANIDDVFETEKQGYRMPTETQLPTLVIPLTVGSAFLTISRPDHITIWTETLHGPPRPESIGLKYAPPTSTHHGKVAPLWTTWTRPLRVPSFFNSFDFIYLARDDGVITYLQADKDAEIRSNNIAELDCNIFNAFASVYHKWTDALLVGGASGTGGVWLAPPRQPLTPLAVLPSAAPTLDFATIDRMSGNQSHEVTLGQVDRIFTVSGTGTKGAITEYRYGLKATVELEWDYRQGVKHAWLFPSTVWGDREEWNLILSFPDCTRAAHFDAAFEDPTDLGADPSPPYDFSSTTLAMQYTDELIVQVTAQYVTMQSPEYKKTDQYSIDTLCGGLASDASICRKCIAFSVEADSQYSIMIYEIDVSQLSLVHKQTLPVEGEVNCFVLTEDSVVAAVWNDGKPFLAKFNISTSLPPPPVIWDLLAMLELSPDYKWNDLEPIASMVRVGNQTLLGTRSGEVITISESGVDATIDIQKFGITTAYLTHQHLSLTNGTVFICCDGRVICRRRPTFNTPAKTRYLQIFPVDDDNLGLAISDVSFAIPLKPPSKVPGCFFALMVSGSKLLLTSVTTDPGLVQRRMSIAGAPTRCMYSRILRCLVVAVNDKDKPTLRFIDPDNGNDLSRPTDKHDNDLTFIGGLGKTGDKILALEPWTFEKDGRTWEYILVSTHTGRLIVVDAVNIEREIDPDDMMVDTDGIEAQPDGGRTDRCIKYWTRFTHKEPGIPIHAVLGCEKGIIYCAGNTIYWEVLDTEAKKLKRIKSFDLESPAISLQMANGKLMALTTKDSLLVIDHSAMEDTNAPSLCHSDPKTRKGTHMIELGASTQPEKRITLVGDLDCGVGGIWIPWQLPLKECESVFEAELTASVRRFRRGHIRPPWEDPHHPPKYGRLLSTLDDADILGISLDGSLHYFTLISVDTWRFLRFIQNLAESRFQGNQRLLGLSQLQTSRSSRPLLDHELKITRGMEMQVNGDLLRICVEERALEQLLVNFDHIVRFKQLMGALELSQGTATLSDTQSCISLAYDVIGYFVSRPFSRWDLKYHV